MPLTAGAAAAIGLGASALSGIIGGATSHYAANKQLQAVRETNATNLQLAREQNDWNLAQWQRESEWQSTPHQLQMWMDAGLNPNTFAGGMQAPTTQSSDLANQVAPDYSMLSNAGAQYAAAFGNFGDYMIKSRQLDQTDRALDQTDKRLGIDTRLAESQIATADKLRQKYDAELNKIIADTDVSKSVADVNRAELRRIAAQTDVYIAQFQNINSQTKNLDLEFAFKQKTFKTRVAQVSADLQKTYSDIWKNEQDVRESVQRVSLMAYDKQIKSQQIDLNGLNIHMYRTRNGMLDLDFKLNKKYREIERANQIFVERCKAFSALLGGVSSLSSFLPYGRSSRLTDAMLGNTMTSSPPSWSNPPAGFTQYY